MKLNIVLTEYYTTTSWRKLEIDTNNYPILKVKQKKKLNLIFKIYMNKDY